MYTYQIIGTNGVSTFSDFVLVAYHMFETRSITWMVIFLVPIVSTVLDVSGKVFSNMYYPSQTQIHCEIESREISHARQN